jgi:glycosyltransferase involved in cell wall biosynthesis
MSEPLVSVLINCYNGEKYLSQAVESVIAQTYRNWEVVFWDNQSSDSSAEKFKHYAKKDNRLKYFYANEHTLLYEARNLAIKKTKGEFIAILDADDWWHPRKLEMQIPYFEDDQVGMVYANYWLVQNNKKKIRYRRPLPHGEILQNLLKDYCIGMLTMVFRKSLVCQNNLLFNKEYQIIGDFDFALRLADRKRISVVQKPLAYYRKHKDSLTEKELERPIIELQKWIRNSKLNRYQLTYIDYSFKRRMIIKALYEKKYRKTIIYIMTLDLGIRFKFKLLLLGLKIILYNNHFT